MSDQKASIKKVMIPCVAQRDMAIQEIMHQLMPLKFLSSLFIAKAVSLNISCLLRYGNNKTKREKSLLDYYTNWNNF